MRKQLLVVDGNSIFYANHNATVLTVGDMQVQGIFGMLKSLQKLMRSVPEPKEIMVLWDGRAEFRFDMYPEYKSNRDDPDPKAVKSKEARKRQEPYVKKALELLGVRQLRSPLLEADDLAGYLVPSLSEKYDVTVVSGDKDWLQLVSPTVTWFDPIRDNTVTLANFTDFTGYFSPQAFIEGKALMGDSSDTIKGVGGIGEKGAPIFLAGHGSVGRFLERFDSGELKKLSKAHANLASPEGRAIFERNMNLMDWRRSRKPEKGEIINNPGTVDVEKFELFCQRLAFASILREFGIFLKAFGITYTKETS